MTSSLSKTPGLEILVDRLFDYSGTFPPACKTLEDALRAAASFSASLKRPGMLGSHIVVDEEGLKYLHSTNLTKFGFAPTSDVRICVLASYDSNTLPVLLERIETSSRDDGVELAVSSLEGKIPPGRSISAKQVVMKFASMALKTGGLIAIEPDLSGDNWKELLDDTVGFLSGQSGVGLKCRCTGPTGIDANRLAHCIASAAERSIPFKTTGGLHHPIVETERWGNTLGFLNLVAAVALRRHFGSSFSVEAVIQLLQNETSDALELSSGLAYGGAKMSVEDLRRARSTEHFSIGSCSLDEPDDDLTRLFGPPN